MESSSYYTAGANSTIHRAITEEIIESLVQRYCGKLLCVGLTVWEGHLI